MINRYKTVVLLFPFLVLLNAFPSQGLEGGASSYRPKYLYAIDGLATGQQLKGISALHIDEEAGELYILDSGNGRVVITDLKGVPLYTFRLFKDEGTGFSSITVDKRGRILLAGGRGVAIFDYKGVFEGMMDLSGIPEKDGLTLQSVAIDRAGHIYLGSGGSNSRIIELDSAGRFVRQIKSGGKFLNVVALNAGSGAFTFLDSGYYKVTQVNRDGDVTLSFGMLSSLLGGFSMPSSLAVDEERKRILVVDTNRLMVIVFDMAGKPLFEFGGPRTFRWPRALTTDKEGHIYVADGADKVHVFDVIEEDFSVEEMVAREGRLLPVFFDVDLDLLDNEAREALDKNAQWLKKNADVKIMIRGYADMRGSDDYNVLLSEKRAKAVMAYLDSRGVSLERMATIPMGRVVSDDTTEEGLRNSRRVDFLVK